MKKKLFFPFILLVIAALACGSSNSDSAPRNAEIIRLVASTNLQSWLDEAAAEFNNEKIKSPDNKPYFVMVEYQDAGEAVSTVNGFQVDLWIPDNQVWVELLAETGNPAYQSNCQSVAQSPLVIAMWQPLAEALGWPGTDLGWLDIGSLAADPTAWEYYSGGQYGSSLRLGHTHPGLSASGTNTLLAVVHAAQSQQNAVSSAAIQEPIVQASVSAFESSVTTFSPSTGALGQLMLERGIQYLGAAVVSENIVFENRNHEPAIVPIYPYEGTFMADFPACIKETSANDAITGAVAFRDYLVSVEGQELAKAHGLRTVNPEVPFEILEDEFAYIDPQEPQIIFEQPSVEAVYAVQDLWQSSRKAVNLVMVIDTSGSMNGDKISNVREAAVEFISAMGDGDFISVVIFDDSGDAKVLTNHAQIASAKNDVIQEIERIDAFGDTPLYDAIGLGAQLIAASNSAQTSNALVVLTDGKDTASHNYRFNQELIDLAMGHDTTIYTIAYGRDADDEMLENLAIRANGNYYPGDEANITEIYQEMSIIFGGSVGIGR